MGSRAYAMVSISPHIIYLDIYHGIMPCIHDVSISWNMGIMGYGVQIHGSRDPGDHGANPYVSIYPYNP